MKQRLEMVARWLFLAGLTPFLVFILYLLTAAPTRYIGPGYRFVGGRRVGGGVSLYSTDWSRVPDFFFDGMAIGGLLLFLSLLVLKLTGFLSDK